MENKRHSHEYKGEINKREADRQRGRKTVAKKKLVVKVSSKNGVKFKLRSQSASSEPSLQSTTWLQRRFPSMQTPFLHLKLVPEHALGDAILLTEYYTYFCLFGWFKNCVNWLHF